VNEGGCELRGSADEQEEERSGTAAEAAEAARAARTGCPGASGRSHTTEVDEPTGDARTVPVLNVQIVVAVASFSNHPSNRTVVM
jgi:hypothetical protein